MSIAQLSLPNYRLSQLSLHCLPMGMKKGRIIRFGQHACAFDMVGGFLASHDRWRIQIAVGYTRENRAVSAIEVFGVYHAAIRCHHCHLVCLCA